MTTIPQKSKLQFPIHLFVVSPSFLYCPSPPFLLFSVFLFILLFHESRLCSLFIHFLPSRLCPITHHLCLVRSNYMSRHAIYCTYTLLFQHLPRHNCLSSQPSDTSEHIHTRSLQTQPVPFWTGSRVIGSVFSNKPQSQSEQWEEYSNGWQTVERITQRAHTDAETRIISPCQKVHLEFIVINPSKCLL